MGEKLVCSLSCKVILLFISCATDANEAFICSNDIVYCMLRVK